MSRVVRENYRNVGYVHTRTIPVTPVVDEIFLLDRASVVDWASVAYDTVSTNAGATISLWYILPTQARATALGIAAQELFRCGLTAALGLPAGPGYVNSEDNPTVVIPNPADATLVGAGVDLPVGTRLLLLGAVAPTALTGASVSFGVRPQLQ